VANAIEAVDGELFGLREALGLANRERYPEYLVEQGFADEVKGSMHETFQASFLASGTFPCGPDALQSRYITEDVPYALVLASSIGDEVGADTPGHRCPDRPGIRRDQDRLADGGADVGRVGSRGGGDRGIAPSRGGGVVVVDLRVAGGTVVTVDGEARVVREDLYVDRGRIASIGGQPREARRTLDATGMLVMPGLINLHDHLRDLTPGIRLGEGLKLDAMLRRFWELSRAAGPDEYRVGAALRTAKLLKSGVTSVVDHLYPFHQAGLTEASIRGYESTGIRWFMARGIMTRPYRPISESARRALRAIEDLADGLVPKERLFVAPVSFRQAIPSEYVQARRLADRLGLRVYTHVAETPAEIDMIRKDHGARPVAFLHDIGFAASDAILVHCVYLSAAEIRMLARSGATVVTARRTTCGWPKGSRRCRSSSSQGRTWAWASTRCTTCSWRCARRS